MKDGAPGEVNKIASRQTFTLILQTAGRLAARRGESLLLVGRPILQYPLLRDRDFYLMVSGRECEAKTCGALTMLKRIAIVISSMSLGIFGGAAVGWLIGRTIYFVVAEFPNRNLSPELYSMATTFR